MLAHWSACAMVLPTTFYASVDDTWVGKYGYGGAPPGEVYIASFYLCLQVRSELACPPVISRNIPIFPSICRGLVPSRVTSRDLA